MSDGRGYFAQHERNGNWVLGKLTMRPRIDRIATPTPKRDTGDIRPGVYVGGSGRASSHYGSFTHVEGQVWSHGPADEPKSWWVVDSAGRAWFMREHSMTIVAQCEQEELSA